MRAYIKKLQSKDEMVRKQILVGSLIVCMSFVSFVWVSSLTGRFNRISNEQVAEGTKPFKLFTNSISDAYTNITASVGKVPNLSKQVEQKTEVNNQKQIDLIPVSPSNN